jgi:hypothetical protein
MELTRPSKSDLKAAKMAPEAELVLDIMPPTDEMVAAAKTALAQLFPGKATDEMARVLANLMFHAFKKEVAIYPYEAVNVDSPAELDDLERRLRGQYRIPIGDGLGPAGGDEPNNPREFVRHYPIPPIQICVADVMAELRRRLAADPENGPPQKMGPN